MTSNPTSQKDAEPGKATLTFPTLWVHLLPFFLPFHHHWFWGPRGLTLRRHPRATRTARQVPVVPVQRSRQGAAHCPRRRPPPPSPATTSLLSRWRRQHKLDPRVCDGGHRRRPSLCQNLHKCLAGQRFLAFFCCLFPTYFPSLTSLYDRGKEEREEIKRWGFGVCLGEGGGNSGEVAIKRPKVQKGAEKVK